jgi:hypothetical protein
MPSSTKQEATAMTATLPRPITAFIEAGNRFDADAMIANFTPDALVNDIQREFQGTDSVKRWIDKEIVGDNVTLEVTETRQHHGTTIVTATVDGTYDKTNVPDPLVLTYYFTVSEDKISTLFVIANKPGY